MEFYPEIKQEPDTSPLVIDEAPRWEEEKDEDQNYSPQLMDLSTKKQQQDNNNYFFYGAATHPESQHCFYEYPPPHTDYYQPLSYDETVDIVSDADDQKDPLSLKSKRARRKSSAIRTGPELESSRAVANHRERQRTKYLNTVLEDLRRIVPSLPSDKLSKKQILMLAAQYIEFLSQVVQCNQPFRGPISRPSSPYKIREELGYCFRVWRMQTEYHGVDSPQ
ncbi:twist-related protein-like [Neocloeon triangulifer]|uniref:twist-related protein-like n=1 Tax=Neocloeon triangulifer TaxID=2078957 RepID=UPI00286ECEF7|nr:twist-related protein-like [Neocloeon triangulifer]